MEMFKVRNWEVFQHYKDRSPPWIKLHYDLLSSETWVMLDDSSRVLAIACMLIASRNEGNVPNNPAYFKRVAYLNKKPNFNPLLEAGFLEKVQALDTDTINQLADASTIQADARPEKRRGEQRREEETATKNFSEKELTQFRKQCPSLTDTEFQNEITNCDIWINTHGSKTPELTLSKWLQRAQKDKPQGKILTSTEQDENMAILMEAINAAS